MKRATGLYDGVLVVEVISIHALVKRATSMLRWGSQKARNFNPRPREEGDRYAGAISLYARDFNPRPREEGDTNTSGATGVTKNFNPRPREEGDVTVLMQICDIENFNPRPREEGDTLITGKAPQ